MHARQLLVALLVTFGVAGCTSARLEKLDVTLRAYERAVRWSEFQTAFAIANQPDAPVPDFQRLKNVRVTAYDKVGIAPAGNDGTKISQAVEIRYVNLNTMNERTLTDQQLWVYVEKDNRWRLVSPFPAFR